MNKKLLDVISRFSEKEIIVWGDFILDEYVYTSVGRISREAPVLVTEFENNEYKLGGAGNVVMNIKALGGAPLPCGFIGKDDDGRILKEILNSHGVPTDYLVELEDFHTPKKSRILSGGENTKKQQVLRIDRLNRSSIGRGAYNLLERELYRLLDNPRRRFLLLSDYLFKSVQPEILQNIQMNFPQKITIVDSRQHLMRFRKVSFATPNEPELKGLFPDMAFYGDGDFLTAGRELREKLEAQGIILKRGHKGMMVFEQEQEPEEIGIYGSADIVDVTGAGDTVLAVTALAMATGAGLTDAARLASIAAGYVVMKEGAYPISLPELKNELS